MNKSIAIVVIVVVVILGIYFAWFMNKSKNKSSPPIGNALATPTDHDKPEALSQYRYLSMKLGSHGAQESPLDLHVYVDGTAVPIRETYTRAGGLGKNEPMITIPADGFPRLLEANLPEGWHEITIEGNHPLYVNGLWLVSRPASMDENALRHSVSVMSEAEIQKNVIKIVS